MTKLLLGIDIGTYSSKGVLYRLDGEILAEAHADHDMSIPKPGYAEHDAENVWWADSVTISKKLTNEVFPSDQIAAVGISAIGPCVLPVDKGIKMGNHCGLEFYTGLIPVQTNRLKS